VNWRLRGRDGKALASGVTQGGSLEPSSFEFTVEYSTAARRTRGLRAEGYNGRFPSVERRVAAYSQPMS
jgi:hypothetical protein